MFKGYSAILAIAVMCFSGVAAWGSVNEWHWGFPYDTIAAGVSGSASDNYDALDGPPRDEPWAIHTGFYHEQGVDDWTGPTGFYHRDIRAPLAAVPGASKTWRLHLWADPTLPPDRETIGLSWRGSGVYWTALHNIEFRLTYVRSAIGVTDFVNVVGSSILLNDYRDGGTWGNLPAVRTENGLDGYIFDLTATVVPEPSALLALAGGLAGLGLPFVRRRRTSGR